MEMIFLFINVYYLVRFTIVWYFDDKGLLLFFKEILRMWFFGCCSVYGECCK